nr:immunoglobulin heavy chain junction region [Macaca mulatta]MOX92943.1 immunoglobulin heavy chain junction region [Macaca mulatta]MOX95817.1 immunoglobulin heavy chain junction region [Macaca mulatta]
CARVCGGIYCYAGDLYW